jgi:hypothetical protein
MHTAAKLLAATGFAVLLATSQAQTTKPEGNPMTTPQPSPTQLPPEVARFLKEPSVESKQFDFLLGEWDVDVIRLNEDGSPLFRYKATWSAKSLNGGRMIMDDFRALGPNRQPVSSYITLRTFSEVTNRWELTGLQALQPSAPAEWYGVKSGEEMLLDATGKSPTGEMIKTRIRFFGISAGSFAWDSSMSLDSGKTWRKTAELRATRVKM